MTAFTRISNAFNLPKTQVQVVTKEFTTDSPLDVLTDEASETDDSLLSVGSQSSSTSVILASAVHGFASNVNSNNLSSHSDTIFSHFNEALAENSKLTMLPNYNIKATGNECGSYLVIDLGGSTLRVAVIDIAAPLSDDEEDRSGRIEVVIENKWEINDSFKNINNKFFDFIASKIFETLNSQSLIAIDPNTIINTGITWSFPLDSISHNRGKIVHVSKGYTVDPEIYNQDLKQVLESAMKRQHDLSLDVKVIINDSLAVYAAGSFVDAYMKLAMVLGTGANMCCSLDTAKLHSEKTLDSDAVLLNSELSMFGMNLSQDLSTPYDKIVDDRFHRASLNFKPHMEVDPDTMSIFQPSELMASGRYLPELTRLVMVDMIKDGELFASIDRKSLKSLYIPYEGFTGELLCAICEGNDTKKASELLTKQYALSQSVCEEDVLKIKTIGNCVIERAAYIVASSIIAFIKLLKDHNGPFTSKFVDIGFVGSVLMYFHSYREKILKFVNENKDIKDLGLEVDLKPIENSSIIGAAIGAAYYINQ
ncbi:hypothetical protein PGUG_00480 [Meyerozyma guilliermondii ATCC 6260]|uniref:Phosphotransferase n=1 Tax=Meyerozyma guilliermondii (strain ATCC 6260 / CBS 566 / DSM 6381 / JCM 1539 / NBRC 10279 / NRRL Y-324) TaxID=294746 RepID=A5DB25_PICGU|nr:uncharacterized protein PGUG_00480 [Meyerozyma guilliermondii ATCC 6260]EDK36382.2 hypothetical protein PGUG_00480 [Meyerozyma guilliermondii ATCC 6260]